MKKTLLFTLFALLGITQAVAQEYEYVPFVREGVKWVYRIYNDGGFYPTDPSVPEGRTYMKLEFKGDTTINGKIYKAMHKYHGDTINREHDTIPIYMREENKVVYGIVPDGRCYADCPIGIWEDHALFEKMFSGEEFILYDFNDPITFCKTRLKTDSLLYTDVISIGKNKAKRYVFNYIGDFSIVEGIGYSGYSSYTLFLWWTPEITMKMKLPNRESYQEAIFSLSYVVEDGEIIYTPSGNQPTPDPEPSDYEYVPLVREGVKWVYRCENPFWAQILDMPEGLHYYSFEMTGDVLIGDKYYKPVRLTHYLDKEGKEKEVEDFIPVYLREEDKVVYAILPDGILHPQCPVGIGSYIGEPDQELPLTTTDEEFVLYDFNDPNALYQSIHTPGTDNLEYIGNELMSIGSHQVKVHRFHSWYAEDELVIEGIGYDGLAGMPLFYFESFISGLQVGYGLSHVIENGELIYKGRWYDPDNRVGIDEVVTERPAAVTDQNYYNLMGQPVGTDVPTTPGIYIHQGKKIAVR
jgi:hypothetical protein